MNELVSTVDSLKEVPDGFYFFLAVMVLMVAALSILVYRLIRGKWDGMAENVAAIRVDLDKVAVAVVTNTKVLEDVANLRVRVRALETKCAGMSAILVSTGRMSRQDDVGVSENGHP